MSFVDDSLLLLKVKSAGVVPSMLESMALPTTFAVSTLTLLWACTPVQMFRKVGSKEKGFLSCRHPDTSELPTRIVSEPNGSGLRNIVLRLGGFHTEMSFLGSIGHLMAGSGLKDVLESFYASNTVVHMLSGKAIARAIRGHFMVDAVLNAVILASSYNVPIPALEMETEELMERFCGWKA